MPDFDRVLDITVTISSSKSGKLGQLPLNYTNMTRFISPQRELKVRSKIIWAAHRLRNVILTIIEIEMFRSVYFKSKQPEIYINNYWNNKIYRAE